MVLLILKEENKDAFRGLFSEEAFSQIGKENVIAVGAVDLNQDNPEEGRPIGGALIVLENTEKCKLDWIYVDETFRRKKVATFMLKQLFVPIKNAGYNEINFMLQDIDSENGIYDLLASLQAEFTADELIIPTLKAFDVLTMLRAYHAPSKVLPASHMGNGTFYEKVNQMAKESPLHNVMPNLWESTTELRSNSYAMNNKGSVDSMILCLPNETENGTLIFDIHASFKMDTLTMLTQVAAKAITVHGQKAMLTMLTGTGAEERLSQYTGGAKSILHLRMGRINISPDINEG